MTWLTKIRKLVKDEKGAMAVMFAVSMAALVGFTGAAVDLGSVYSARSELQNATDSAALAAAATMISYNQEMEAIATPGEALNTAHLFTGKHKVVKLVPEDPEDPESPKVPVNLPMAMMEADFEIGRWNHDLGDFEVTGFSDDPDDLTAVRVKLRRDSLANDPITTYFAKMAGFDDIPVTTTTVAFLGYAGSVPPQDPDGPPGGGTEGGGLPVLPIAIHATAIGNGENFPDGMDIQFANENDENAVWHAFFEHSANDSKIRQYAAGTRLSPGVKIGDILTTTNGKLSQQTFRGLEGRFKTPVGEGGRNNGNWEEPEPWPVYLPVIECTNHCGKCKNARVVGFVTYVVTDVRDAPHKDVHGYVSAGYVIPNSFTVGANFGTRAMLPVIYNTEG